MKPHLLALNLNGMVKGGDKVGKKILPLGAGDLDLGLLKAIRDSGYAGPSASSGTRRTTRPSGSRITSTGWAS